MKMIKKAINIVLIMIIIQFIVIMFFNNNVFAETRVNHDGSGGVPVKLNKSVAKSKVTSSDKSIFGEAADEIKEWEKMKEGDTSKVLANATQELNTTIQDDIGNAVRVFGVGAIIVYIAYLFIRLNLTGADIAEAKMKITVLAIIAIIFIFADPIMNFLKDLAGKIEALF